MTLDGSEGDAWTLERAAGLLEGATVTLLGVVQAPPHLAADLAFRVDPRHADFNAALAAARRRLPDASAEIRFGDPGDAVLREIREGGHDLVILSRPDRRVLRGSAIPSSSFGPTPRPALSGGSSRSSRDPPTRRRSSLRRSSWPAASGPRSGSSGRKRGTASNA